MTVLASDTVSPRIPFVKGLTTVAVANSPVGDYETLRTITEINPKSYTLRRVGEAPADSGEGLIPIDLKRRVRAQDQLHSRNVRIEWHSSDRESMTGNAPGISCDLFQELRTQGQAQLTYISIGLAGIAATDRLTGTVTVIDRKPAEMLVNRQTVMLPALHVQGDLQGNGARERFDFHVLDDPDNPLLLSAGIKHSQGRIVAIEYPIDADNLTRTLRTTEVIELSGVYFAFASATLRTESDETLTQLAQALDAFPSWRFRIEGHTDSIGNDASNLALSKRRADAVRSALVARFGVPVEQLTTEGYGEKRPRQSNDTDVGRARNRRVELVRVSPDDSPPQTNKTAAALGVGGSACKFSGVTGRPTE
jgi:outer membrane protein OmpA-like peptidoglycan-associated protein